jgi:hypothetical protein
MFESFDDLLRKNGLTEQEIDAGYLHLKRALKENA